jgi:hypothetical protein
MPDHCMIDDSIGVLEYDGSAIDSANEDSSPIVLQTPLPASQNNQSRSLRKGKGMESILEKMNAEQHEVTNAVKEMVGIMGSAGVGSRSSTSGLLGGKPHEIIEQINKSKALIAMCENELKVLFRRKRAIKSNSSELTLKQLKKIKIISKSIRAEKSMIITLRNAMEDQCKRLASITK